MELYKIFTSDERKTIERVKLAFGVFNLKKGKINPILVTDGLCKMFKRDRDSLMLYFSTTIGLQIYPEDRPIINENFIEVVKNPSMPVSFEYRFHVANEPYFWVKNEVTPEKLADGSYIYYIFYRDNSEAHKSLPTNKIINSIQFSKKENEYLYTKGIDEKVIIHQILHQIMSNANFFYLIYDVETKLIIENNTFRGLFKDNSYLKNYPEFIFTMKLVHIDDKEKYYSAFNKSIYEGKVVEENFHTLNRLTNEYEPMHFKFTPIKRTDGTVKTIIGTVEHSTNNDKMFSTIRLLLNQNELISWNYNIAESKLNIGKSDFKTKELDMVRTLVHNALLDGTIKIPEKLIQGKTNQTYEIISLSNEIGSIYKFEITHTIIKGKSTPLAIIGMARDVTKYYAMEDSYISKLEKANTNKTAFLGRLSHDMRTPLGAIEALSNFGLEEVKDEKALLYFSKIKDNSEYLLSFITDILESRKIGENALSFQPEVFVPATLFKQIISIIQLRAVDKDINLELDACDCFEKYYLFNDITKIKKVGINLLSNAIKYTPRGGKVKVKLSSEIISEKYLKVICSISDNGVGMSKDFQEHMYDEFSQEHNRLSFEEEGTGLGLSIVKRIIKIIDGTISCESELNKGTTFTVTFNSKFATEEQIEEFNRDLNIDNLDKLRNKRILICEDKKINIMIESKLLNDSGILVDVAQNGQIGVLKALDNKYDAILMDVRMPVMDGLKATSEIRKNDKDIPIIALSANATQEDKIKSIEAGMNDHISKPINKDELYRVLYKYIK